MYSNESTPYTVMFCLRLFFVVTKDSFVTRLLDRCVVSLHSVTTSLSRDTTPYPETLIKYRANLSCVCMHGCPFAENYSTRMQIFKILIICMKFNHTFGDVYLWSPLNGRWIFYIFSLCILRRFQIHFVTHKSRFWNEVQLKM